MSDGLAGSFKFAKIFEHVLNYLCQKRNQGIDFRKKKLFIPEEGMLPSI